MWGSRDPILEFWVPLISPERLKLETSNLARRRTAVSSNNKNSKLGQKGSCGGHVTQFWNFGTPLISRERLKLETLNLARRWTTVSFSEKKIKIGSKWVMWVSRDPILVFWDPPYISRKVEARNFKFSTETDGGEFLRNKFKIGSILEFWDPANISRRLKLETSNLARWRTVVSSNEKKSKLGQKGSCGCHVTQFSNFGTPLISRERLKLETSNLARRRMAVSSCKINSKLG